MNGMDHKTGDDGEGAFFGMVYSGETRPRPIVHRPAVWLAGHLHRVAGWLWDWAERPADGVPLTAEQIEAHTIIAREVLAAYDDDPEPARWLVQGLEPAPDIRFHWAPGHVAIFEGTAEEEFLAERQTIPEAPEQCPAVWSDPVGQSRCVLVEGHEGHHETGGGILWQGWATVGRCDDVAPALDGSPTGPRCVLSAGHDGHHQAGDAEWYQL